MRWGVRDEATDDHMTTELCMKEIENCQRLSMGPNFVVKKIKALKALFKTKFIVKIYPLTLYSIIHHNYLIYYHFVGISWTKIWLSANPYVYYFVRIGIIKGGIGKCWIRCNLIRYMVSKR